MPDDKQPGQKTPDGTPEAPPSLSNGEAASPGSEKVKPTEESTPTSENNSEPAIKSLWKEVRIIDLINSLVGIGTLAVAMVALVIATDTKDIKDAVTNLSTLASQSARQAKAAEDQLAEMRNTFASERAYLFESNIGYTIGATMKPKLKVAFTFKNFGKTPAILRSVAGKCAYFNVLPDPIVKDDNGALQFQISIGSGDPVGPYPQFFGVSQQQIDAAREGNGSMRCIYNAWYSDVRQNEHMSGICVVYSFRFKGFLYCPEPVYRDTYQKLN